jgi:hypothetical protein
MLDTARAIPAPYLAQAPVEALLSHFATALPWLTNPYGLVQTGVDKKGTHRYPQLYRQDGGLHHMDVYPEQTAAAVSFFEYNGPTEVAFTDPMQYTGDLTHPLALVAWVNLQEIDPQRGYDFSSELALDVLTQGLQRSPLGSRLVVGEIEQRAERIFARYSFPQERQQLLMYPFAGFRIPFTVTQRYVPCAAPFTPLSGVVLTSALPAGLPFPLG